MIALVLASQAGLWLWLRAETARLDRLLQEQGRQREGLLAGEVFPAEENARLVAADRASFEGWDNRRRAALDVLPAPAALTRTDAFFSLARAVDGWREAAGRAGVELTGDERFGFAAFAREAPPVGELPLLAREIEFVGHVLDALFASRPQRLVSLRRERSGGGRPFSASNDPEASVLRLRIEFVGFTSSCRAFLNEVGGHTFPMALWALEVEPWEAAASLEADASGSIPLVPRNRSRFTVTIDHLPGFVAWREAAAFE